MGWKSTYSMTSVPYEACVLGQSSTIDLQLWGFPFRQPLANLDITDGHGDFIRFCINGDQIAIYTKRFANIRQQMSLHGSDAEQPTPMRALSRLFRSDMCG